MGRNIEHIDLHTHTNLSDGDLAPDELLERARRHHLAAIAITDHDTVDAYTQETLTKADQVGIELVPGIELSTQDADGNPYHMLGLLIDTQNNDLTDALITIQDQRIKYALTVSDLLERELQITIDKTRLATGHRSVTKAHIARAAIGNENNEAQLRKLFSGKIPTEGEFIEKTIVKGQPCYVQAQNILRPQTAVELIHSANGLAILAHPSFYIIKRDEIPNALCQKVKSWNGDGIEAINVQYDRTDDDKRVEHIDIFTSLASGHGLVISGGSDFHTSGARMGKVIDLGFRDDRRHVPYQVLDQLKERKARITR